MQERKITNELITEFEMYLYEEERSGNTIEKYMRDIRFFREWLQDRNIDKSVVIENKKELCERGGADIFLDYFMLIIQGYVCTLPGSYNREIFLFVLCYTNQYSC